MGQGQPLHSYLWRAGGLGRPGRRLLGPIGGLLSWADADFIPQGYCMTGGPPVEVDGDGVADLITWWPDPVSFRTFQLFRGPMVSHPLLSNADAEFRSGDPTRPLFSASTFGDLDGDGSDDIALVLGGGAGSIAIAHGGLP